MSSIALLGLQVEAEKFFRKKWVRRRQGAEAGHASLRSERHLHHEVTYLLFRDCSESGEKHGGQRVVNKSDFSNCRCLVRVTEKLKGLVTRQRAFDVALLDSFAAASLQELDYLNEAANQVCCFSLFWS
jgi:hypothetical protein